MEKNRVEASLEQLEERVRAVEGIRWPETALKDLKHNLKTVEQLIEEVEALFDKTKSTACLIMLSSLLSSLQQ